MCGIAGIASVKVGGYDARLAKEMCRVITRRGPDDEGYYFGDRVALGMRRLAIIDVKSGQQPVHNEDKTVWVVFNGEIYNFRELRRELEQRGHTLRTWSDTECLVHLYEDYGDDFVLHLRGMFGIAIWDDRKKKLLLARDRLGIKPLYYRVKQGDLHFGSEMKCLLAADDLERRINARALSDFVTYKYVPGPMTIYEGVQELAPAHLAIWQGGELAIRRYWMLPTSCDEGKSLDYFREGLLHHLRDAVESHLVSEVPLGAFLSGGIDSSAIVSLMARGGTRPVKTFTVGFQAGQFGIDERPFAKTVAEACKTDHSECLYEDPQGQIESILPSIITAFDEPFADSSMIPNYLVCEAARKWVTVALSGLGGDELFAGYERYRGALLGDYYQRIPAWFRHSILKRGIEALPESRGSGLWIDRMKRFIDGAELPLAQRYQAYLAAYDESEKRELFSEDLLNELDKSGRYRSLPAMSRMPEQEDHLGWVLSADMQTYLPDDELRKADRLSMWHSLEVRVPFLDHTLVEFAAAIPSRYKLHRWQKKYVLIEALRGLVPDIVLTRRKQGFSIPLANWLRGPLREFVRDHLSETSLKDAGLFNTRVVARLLDEHDRFVRNHETKIWVLLTFMIWRELYLKRRSGLKDDH
jgi:asparagine synthase (glutamine-hydrolysing)